MPIELSGFTFAFDPSLPACGVRFVTPMEPSRAEPILLPRNSVEGSHMRSIILWLIGVPIPIILLLALCTHHF